MTNVQTFEQQVENFTTALVSVITSLAPLILILIILGVAGANGFVEYRYQHAVFGSLAWFPAILIAGFRFSAGLGGIALIKKARYIPGIAFVFVSLLLTLYSWWHVETIAAGIAPQAAAQAVFSISVVLWSGWVGELLLVAYVGVSGNLEGGHRTSWWPAKEKAEKNGVNP